MYTISKYNNNLQNISASRPITHAYTELNNTQQNK